MENLVINPTKSTPEILFNAKENILEIKGISYPENTSEFYEPVFNWLNTYLGNLGNQKVTINIEIVYFNSSSSKVLMDFFDILDETAEKGKKITVNWIYDKENTSIKEYGEEFKEDLNYLEFLLIKKD